MTDEMRAALTAILVQLASVLAAANELLVLALEDERQGACATRGVKIPSHGPGAVC